ncbi:MAG: Hsp20/alpha crystallin family protein [Pseudomonadota bacterium]
MILRRMTGLPSWGWRSSFDELDRMRRQMEILNESLEGRLYGEPRAGVFPLMNVTEDKEGYYIRAELPGIKADELDISVTGNTLSISGERKIPSVSGSAKYHRKEREEGQFSRILTLPSQVDTEKVEARSANGILTVILPKAEEAKPKQIAVKVS